MVVKVEELYPDLQNGVCQRDCEPYHIVWQSEEFAVIYPSERIGGLTREQVIGELENCLGGLYNSFNRSVRPDTLETFRITSLVLMDLVNGWKM